MKTTVHIEYHMYTWYYTTPKSSTTCDFVCAVALRVRESTNTACAQAVQCGHGGVRRSRQELFTQRLTVNAEAVRGVAVCQRQCARISRPGANNLTQPANNKPSQPLSDHSACSPASRSKHSPESCKVRTFFRS